MAELSSKLCRNENNIDITSSNLLTKITGKYIEILEFDLFKEKAFGSNQTF